MSHSVQKKSIALGRQILSAVEPALKQINELKNFLQTYPFSGRHEDDVYVWLSSVLALQASNQGNFGVGALLINDQGEVAAYGHNEVFSPYFRSDLHAEMVVMDRFENANPELTNVGGYTLYTSLEPCPMCLVRLSTSGLNRILHAAHDIDGGMVSRTDDLPPFWLNLTHHKVFSQADCSEALIDACSRIFLLDINDRLARIRNRS